MADEQENLKSKIMKASNLISQRARGSANFVVLGSNWYDLYNRTTLVIECEEWVEDVE